MSNWGLLGGIGRGLNQFGGTLNQGLNNDITAKRQQEAEAQRQASIEKRWARQDAQQAKRDELAAQQRTEDKSWREERAKVGDQQNERSMRLRENQSIESNMSGILSAQQKAETDIYKRYEKQSKDSMGMPLQGEALAQLNQAMQEEIKQTRKQYQTMIEQRVSSYGERLRGTGYEYLLDMPDKSTTDKLVPREGVPSSDQDKAILSREERMTKILQGDVSEAEDGAPQSIGFADGFNKTAHNTDKNASDLSPMESFKYTAGAIAGQPFGLLSDGAQAINENIIQPVSAWATTKPSQRK